MDLDELVLPLMLLGGTTVLFATGLGAARYAGWYGIVAPAAVWLALGVGWEWQADAGMVIVAVAIVLLVGFAVGLARRRRVRPSNGPTSA